MVFHMKYVLVKCCMLWRWLWYTVICYGTLWYSLAYHIKSPYECKHDTCDMIFETTNDIIFDFDATCDLTYYVVILRYDMRLRISGAHFSLSLSPFLQIYIFIWFYRYMYIQWLTEPHTCDDIACSMLIVARSKKSTMDSYRMISIL